MRIHFDQEAWKEQAVSLLFPRRCPVCGEIVVPRGELICPDCKNELSFVSGSLCLKCGKELLSEDGEYCQDCMRRRRTFDRGAALLNYNEVSARSIAQIKYKNKREYLDFYSQEMVRRLGKRMYRMQADALIPVPVHPDRKRTRGYNQAEELANRIGKRTGIPVCSHVLVRSKKTAPQKELTPEQRLKNLEQAFSVKEETLREFWPKLDSVILVDDIYTTGSTIEACARVLKRAGIRKVSFISICIGGDR
ncbi:MAG: ComF family protein [Lachnospiraceae bacterium]|nr:ComF family protein [Lachnospiraceae bacterium]